MVDETSSYTENSNSERAVSINLCGARVALGDEDDHNLSEDDSDSLTLSSSIIPPNTNLNIEGSSDVIVGPVTQIHGPVTIYQNTHNTTQLQNDSPRYLPNILSEESSTISGSTTFSAAKLVTTEALSSKPLGNINIPFSKRKLTLITLLAVITIMLIIIVVCFALGFFIPSEGAPPSDGGPPLGQTATDQPQIPNTRHKLIYRDRWGGRKPLFERKQHLPVKYIIISHTASDFCEYVPQCSNQMAQMQSLHVSNIGSPDIGYNFVIGGDANIYVGRDWDVHNFHMNLDTIGISFIGNYIYNDLTAGMVEAAQELIQFGVQHGKLDKDYILVAHNQTFNTQSPGPNVYRRMKYWPHFSSEVLVDIPDKN